MIAITAHHLPALVNELILWRCPIKLRYPYFAWFEYSIRIVAGVRVCNGRWVEIHLVVSVIIRVCNQQSTRLPGPATLPGVRGGPGQVDLA